MKKLAFFIILLVQFLSGLLAVQAQDSTVIPVGLGSGACAGLTVETHRSEACDAEIAAYTLPDLTMPVVYDETRDQEAHPRGVLLPQASTPFPIAWQKRPWYFSDAPGTYPADNDWTNERRIDRYTMYYIYHWIEVNGIVWYLIGPGQWMEEHYVSVLQPPARPEGVSGPWVAVDQTQQVLIAMLDDQPIWATLVSTGYWLETTNGLFRIYARTASMTMQGPPGANPPEYVLPNTRYVMFFNEHIGLHGAYYHNSFGYKRSHGCINIVPGEAEWLWNFVDTYGGDWDSNLNSFAVDQPEKAPWVLVYESSRYVAAPSWGG